MPLRLVATTGTQTVTLPPGRPLVVGRTPGCDLPVRDVTVSRRHAELVMAEGGLEIRDLESTNGTFVNGERIARGVARPGDQVIFGRASFELREEAEEGFGEAIPVAAQALDATVIRRRPVAASGGAPWTDSGPVAGAVLRELASPAERQARRLEFLLDAAKALSGQPDIDRLLARLVELAVGVMDVDRAGLLLVEEEGRLATRAAHDRGDGGPLRVPEAVAREAVEQRVALLIENAGADPRFDLEIDQTDAERKAVESALCAPLLGRDGTVLGLLYLDSLSAPRSFDDEDLDFLVSFAGLAAVALENSRLIERVRREAAVLANFQRYFAPELAEEIAAEQGEIRLGGAKRQVVVLFSDIRGFTALSEELPPDELAVLLNEYFTEMVEIVFEHGGTLDKFMGDAMMALWGAPVARLDDADRAARAAVAMQHEIARLNRRWSEAGRQTLAVGIGLNAGEAFAGNIGSDRRLEYTVIGDVVNTAALLCARAGAGEILAGEPVCQLLADPPPLSPLDPLQLKTKAQTVPVFQIAWNV